MAHRSSGETGLADHRCTPRDSVDELMTSWREGRPDLDFWPVAVIARLARVRMRIDAELDAVFAAHALSAANFSVVVTLARVGGEHGVPQRRLMDELALTSGTISIRIDRLVDEGLVDRRPDPESKRNTLITLTARGREVFERVAPAHLANERRLLSALTDDEQDLLAALLRKLLVEYEGSTPPPEAPLHLGLTLAPAHQAMAMRQSVGLDPVPGLLVRATDDDGPAAAAGIRAGDVLRRAARRDLRSISALYAAISDSAESGKLRLELARGSEEQHVTVALCAPQVAGAAAPAQTAGRAGEGLHRV